MTPSVRAYAAHSPTPPHGLFDLDTVPCVHNVKPSVPTVATGGTLAMVGYLGPLDPALNTAPLVLDRRAVAGSLVGGIAEMQEMLDFCGAHGITSDVKTIRIQDIEGGCERMLKSDVKYRSVIDVASLRDEVAA